MTLLHAIKRKYQDADDLGRAITLQISERNTPLDKVLMQISNIGYHFIFHYPTLWDDNKNFSGINCNYVNYNYNNDILIFVDAELEVLSEWGISLSW